MALGLLGIQHDDEDGEQKAAETRGEADVERS